MKHPNAKAIGLPDVGGEFGSCSLMDFTEFDLQRILSTAFTHHISGVTLHTSYARYKLWGYYNKLAVFIPNAKDV
ncbi:SsrA-binding protein [Helicobacter pylori]|uniref:SsrA-binding protein n=1 Tax=Helicobacter pylori TaxID=210 RepID=UPI001E5AD845|nr:SsrA-binding protein [Helicobacter pylori]